MADKRTSLYVVLIKPCLNSLRIVEGAPTTTFVGSFRWEWGSSKAGQVNEGNLIVFGEEFSKGPKGLK
jgi:hypothetical protein